MLPRPNSREPAWWKCFSSLSLTPLSLSLSTRSHHSRTIWPEGCDTHTTLQTASQHASEFDSNVCAHSLIQLPKYHLAASRQISPVSSGICSSRPEAGRDRAWRNCQAQQKKKWMRRRAQKKALSRRAQMQQRHLRQAFGDDQTCEPAALEPAGQLPWQSETPDSPLTTHGRMSNAHQAERSPMNWLRSIESMGKL